MKWKLEALKALSKNETVPGIALQDAISEIEKLNVQLMSKLIIIGSLETRLSEYAISNEKLKTVLKVLLDQIDYENGACSLTEMIGAVLPGIILKRAREVLK